MGFYSFQITSVSSIRLSSVPLQTVKFISWHGVPRSDIPGLGKLISMYNAYPVNRGAPDLGALRKTISLLKAGNVVLMFPEGTRSVDGTLGKARDGACFIADRAGVPTIPVFHSGAEQMLPRNSRRLRRAKLTVTFGEPLELLTGEFETRREMYQQMGNQMMGAIADLRDSTLSSLGSPE